MIAKALGKAVGSFVANFIQGAGLVLGVLTVLWYFAPEKKPAPKPGACWKVTDVRSLSH
jgi:hypothetical protein